ncbi:MAG: AIPR family protein [Bacteroidales bacterium]|nr:AIPR family protein [Bacteroidales bacterium]
MEFYDRIKEQVSALTENQSYQNDGTAFGHFIIKECFNKIIDFEYDGNDFDQFVKDHIVDMANDLGNDAIFTNQNNNEILVFQFKYSKGQLLNTDEIKKNKRFIDWILKLNGEELRANPKLRKVIDEEILPILTEDNISNNNFYITFYYIDSDFKGNIKTDINALYTNYNDKNINFDIKYYNYQELEELYDDIEIPKNEVELKIVEDEYFNKKTSYFDGKETEIETIVTSIYANSLKPIIEDKKELILALNVRYYKGENEINSKIKKEYSKGEKSNFWILNNGINGVCEDFELQDNDTLKIKNFQIVNGGQTAKTLTRIVNDLPDSVQILMRLTKIKDKTQISKISMDIAVASNSQNAISARDLHSGDRIQTKIFKHLNEVGIFYDKKDGEWATVNKRKYRNPFGNSPMHLKIRNLDLGVAYLSFYLQIPISTVGRHKLVFSELFYDKIFDMSNNEDDQFYKLILAYRISERVNIVKNDRYSKYEVLWNNYINDVLLSLSALFFFKDELHSIENENELKNKTYSLTASDFINSNDRFTLNIEDDFDQFLVVIIKALQYFLDVMKQAKKFQGEEWLPNDTNKWLKKDGTYKGIFEAVIKKIKEE